MRSRRQNAPLQHARAFLKGIVGFVGRSWPWDKPGAGARSRDYAAWIREFDFNQASVPPDYVLALKRLAKKPPISVLMPAIDSNPGDVDAAIRSVRRQLYVHWELCVVDDGSPTNPAGDLLRKHAAEDPRIKVHTRQVSGDVAEATHSALAIATGDYLAVLDRDGILREHALAEMALAINAHPDALLLYSDEDKIDDDGLRFDPRFKPDWSPDLFLSQNYLRHLTALRTDAVRALGGWRKGFEGSEDYDLALRIVEEASAGQIIHIAKVLYHCRVSTGSDTTARADKDRAFAAGLHALEEHLACTRAAGHAEIAPGPYYRVVRNLPDPPPLASLIIPSRDMAAALRCCVESILAKTDYSAYEIIVIDNGSKDPEALHYLEQIESQKCARVLRYDKEFNYSAINNFAVRHSKGEVIVLLNNDVEVITPGWLRELVSQASRAEIGCVGAKLYYPNDTIQHAGVILGVGGIAGHAHKTSSRDSDGYFGRLRVIHNVSAVTGACLAVRREIYEQAGGLDEQLAVAYNDVDFCLRIARAGYLNLMTPYAELYHHESLSRGYDFMKNKSARLQREARFMLDRWGDVIDHDPYYSPNLTLASENFGLRVRRA